MRRETWLLPLALLCVFLSQESASAATVRAASCSQSDLMTAVNAAGSGDTVQVPGGSATWTATVSIPNTKGITVDGGTCTVTTNTKAFDVKANNTTTTRITNFRFTSTSTPVYINIDGSTSSATYRVDHNSFNSSDVMISVSGNGPGLIDNNTFHSASRGNEIIHNTGMGASSTAGWSDDVMPGSAKMVFIEDNTFTLDINNPNVNTSQPYYFWGASAVQSYYGARTVFRHNTLNNMQVDQHGTHGMVGARWWEIYENTFFTGNGSAQCCYMAIRAGSGVIFNNHHTGTNGADGTISLFEEDTGYPALYQIGRGINQSISPAYVWGNDADMRVGSGSSNVVEGRDFFGSKPSVFERAELGSDTSATTYAYTPYTYPHPLQNGQPPTQTQINPPTGLTAMVQ